MRRALMTACLSIGLASAQLWIRALDGGFGLDDEAVDLALDSAGNTLTTGQMSSIGYYTAGTTKHDGQGNTVWVRKFQPVADRHHVGRAIAVDEEGCAYVGAASENIGNIWRFAVVKIGPAGDSLWVSFYSDSAGVGDIPNGLAVCPAGRVNVAGYFGKAPSDQDMGTISYRSNGTRDWVREYDGPDGGIDRANALICDGQGNTYVAGFATEGARKRAAIVCYDSLGNQKWLRLHVPPGPYDDCEGTSIALDYLGNVFVVGSVGSVYFKILSMKLSPDGDTLWTRELPWGRGAALDVDEAGSLHVVGTDEEHSDSADIVVAKYGPSGDLVWVSAYDGPDRLDDFGYGIATADSGVVYICGSSQGEEHGTEGLLVKYNAQGDTVWAARIPGEGRYGTVGNAVAVDTQGNIIVAGSINKSSTGNDYLVAKYPPSGPGIAESPSRPVPRHGVNVTPSVARSNCLLTGNACSDGYRFLISDMSGRIVRRLSSNQPPSNSVQAVWELDDNLGHQVPNGVYFVTLDAPRQSACAKIIVQR